MSFHSPLIRCKKRSNGIVLIPIAICNLMYLLMCDYAKRYPFQGGIFNEILDKGISIWTFLLCLNVVPFLDHFQNCQDCIYCCLISNQT